jgi:NhaP-type Na+/H+ and K+/H+ antiporter
MTWRINPASPQANYKAETLDAPQQQAAALTRNHGIPSRLRPALILRDGRSMKPKGAPCRV